MRKLLTIGTASVALLSATQAMAADSTVTYDIGATCEVRDLDSVVYTAPELGDPGLASVRSEFFTLICDDPHGATLSLTTANGGAQHSEDPNLIVNYTATVVDTVPSTAITTAPVLRTNGVPGESVTEILPASTDLATPNDQNAALSVQFSQPFPFSGTYTDTVSIDITGNP